MFGGGHSGPPAMPVGLPPITEADEFGRPLHGPRPGLTPRARWAWLAAAAFAVLALALKLVLWSNHAPSALFGALAAFILAIALWGWLMPARATTTDQPRGVCRCVGGDVEAACRLGVLRLLPAAGRLRTGEHLHLDLGFCPGNPRAGLGRGLAISRPAGCRSQRRRAHSPQGSG